MPEKKRPKRPRGWRKAKRRVRQLAEAGQRACQECGGRGVITEALGVVSCRLCRGLGWRRG